MTDKETQLFILRHLEAGNTKVDEHILVDIPADQRRYAFIEALIAIENQGFLCSGYVATDKPELWNSYVSPIGRAFIRENTPEPLVQKVGRQTFRLLDIILITFLTSIIGAVVALMVAWYISK